MKRYLFLLLLCTMPALAQAPSSWSFAPICRGDRLIGLMIGTKEPGVVGIRFDVDDLCKDHI